MKNKIYFTEEEMELLIERIDRCIEICDDALEV